MFISKHWLEDFIKIPKDLSAEAIASKLTLSTVEVEGVKKLGADLAGIVVGKIESVEKHPNADRLKVCMVDVGNKFGSPKSVGRSPIQVVCGGSNVREGMFVALGTLGAKVRWHGEGELIELKKTNIRGVDSYGMICAADEIGLGEMFPKSEEKEILDLTKITNHQSPITNHNVGTPLAEVLGLNDVVFDIDNKSLSNRPDLWGHYGMAREVASLLGIKFKPYQSQKVRSPKSEVRSLNVRVEDKDLCPRYMVVAIDNIEVGSSPAWMQARLQAVGVNPINNIVDITNYVMLELGQPMHAFDTERLSDFSRQTSDSSKPKSEVRSPKSIIVRKAKKGEKIMTLKNEECELSPEMLVIADSEKPIAVAGVIGGLETAITETTTCIIFESANFNPASVRKTANALGVRTDSSARFEKSLDPTNAEVALRRAVELTLQLNPKARIASDVADVSHFNINQGPIALPLLFVEKKLGVRIEKKKIVSILESLGFGVKEKRDVLFITIPTWRATRDISIPEDVVEEIARVSGYDHISASLPRLDVAPPLKNSLRELERHIKEFLAYEHRMTEVYNYSFESPEWLAKLGVEMDQYLELDNPIAKDRPLLRKHIIPNMLENVEKNAHRFDSVRLFEVGRVFRADMKALKHENMKVLSGLPEQDTMLGLVSAGKSVDVPFYDLSDVVLGLGTRLGIDISVVATAPQALFTHPGRHARLEVENQEIGRIAELHPATQETLGIPYRTAIVQINLNELLKYTSDASSYQPLSQYPSIERDIAFVVDRDMEHASIVQALESVDPLITSVELFDVYEGKGIEKGKKSMAYRMVYRSNDRTLTSDDADLVHKKVIGILEKNCNAKMRV